jgi:hypothetical protein
MAHQQELSPDSKFTKKNSSTNLHIILCDPKPAPPQDLYANLALFCVGSNNFKKIFQSGIVQECKQDAGGVYELILQDPYYSVLIYLTSTHGDFIDPGSSIFDAVGEKFSLEGLFRLFIFADKYDCPMMMQLVKNEFMGIRDIILRKKSCEKMQKITMSIHYKTFGPSFPPEYYKGVKISECIKQITKFFDNEIYKDNILVSAILGILEKR